MTEKTSKELKPIIKWVGGKRQLLDEIIPLVPEYNRYIEPFLGGAAVLLALRPKKAIVNDFNSELVNLYRVVKENPEELISELKKYENTKECFYKTRNIDRTSEFDNLSDIKKASRILFLNKTCFNGLYRVNSKGEFNTPFGRYKNPNIVNEDEIRTLSNYLNINKIMLLNGDFKLATREAKKRDFVYLDPPYAPISKTSAYTGYTLNGFGEEKQIELKKECDRLNAKGIKFLQSNSDCELIRELYKDYTIKTVKATRNINCKAESRSAINELLIYNY